MGHVIGHIHIGPNQIIIFEKVCPVIYSQRDRPCDIQGSTATNSNDRVSLIIVVHIGTLVHVRLNRVFMEIKKYFCRNVFLFQIVDDVLKKVELGNICIGN